METITIPKHVVEQSKEALRIAANILDSRGRETAADRQIEFAERLLYWVLDGQKSDMPKWIPGNSTPRIDMVNEWKNGYDFLKNIKEEAMETFGESIDLEQIDTVLEIIGFRNLSKRDGGN